MDRCKYVSQAVYLPYVPSSRFKDVGPHPCDLVEATSLSYARSPPLTYELSTYAIPDIRHGTILSAAQLEAINLTCQKQEEILPNGQRAGFYLGDSTGLGKGRIIAGIILENFLRGRRTSVWITLCTDLFESCVRDLKDVDVRRLEGVEWHPETKRIPSFTNKTLLVTYSTLSSKKLHRVEELVRFLTPEFDGVVVFDESHRAKGAFRFSVNKGVLKKKKATAVGEMVHDLQEFLPKARIVYVSATAASTPEDLSYMSRLGIWGEGASFPTLEDFVENMLQRGMSSMEALAVNLKKTGNYICRQMCARNIQHDVIRVPMSPEFEEMYNDAVVMFETILRNLNEIRPMQRRNLACYWTAHQNFFANLCVASKISTAAAYAKSEKESGRCVVIGIQKTGEARFKDLLKNGNPYEHFSSSACIIECLFNTLFGINLANGFIIKPACSFPTAKKPKLDSASTSGDMVDMNDYFDPDSDVDDSEIDESDSGDEDCETTTNLIPTERILRLPMDHTKLSREYQSMIDEFENLKGRLPKNPLDDLVEQLGGGDFVAELTGRKHRQLSNAKGSIDLNIRKEHTTDKLTNRSERNAFQNEIKRYVIISDASSTGVSLHSDKTVLENPRLRTHITLEVPWSAEKLIQQLGRTHRSGQAGEPKHVFIVSSIPGEERFITSISERLKAMNAITQGDRRSGSNQSHIASSVSCFSYGNGALSQLISCLSCMTPFPFRCEFGREELLDAKIGLSKVGIGSMKGTTYYGVGKKKIPLKQFYNRMLGMTTSSQKTVITLFYKFAEHIANQASRITSFHVGIMDMEFAEGVNVYQGDEVNVPRQRPLATVHMIEADFGLSFDSLQPLMRQGAMPSFFGLEGNDGRKDLFYVYTEASERFAYSPNDVTKIKLTEEKFKVMKRISPQDVKRLWEYEYELMDDCKCIHEFMKLVCRDKSCHVSSRNRRFVIVTGDINRAWTVLRRYTKLDVPNIMRVRLTDGTSIVGVVLEGDDDLAENLVNDLKICFAFNDNIH